MTATIDQLIEQLDASLDLLRRAKAALQASGVTIETVPTLEALPPAPIVELQTVPPEPAPLKYCPGPKHKNGNRLRPLDEFARDASKSDGRQRICRTCMSAERKARRAKAARLRAAPKAQAPKKARKARK